MYNNRWELLLTAFSKQHQHFRTYSKDLERKSIQMKRETFLLITDLVLLVINVILNMQRRVYLAYFACKKQSGGFVGVFLHLFLMEQLIFYIYIYIYILTSVLGILHMGTCQAAMLGATSWIFRTVYVLFHIPFSGLESHCAH